MPPRLTCDSVPHTYDINVFPDAGSEAAPPSAPLRRANAMISVDVSNIYNQRDRVSTGPQTIRLN